MGPRLPLRDASSGCASQLGVSQPELQDAVALQLRHMCADFAKAARDAVVSAYLAEAEAITEAISQNAGGSAQDGRGGEGGERTELSPAADQ